MSAANSPVGVPDPAEVEACRCWQQMSHVRGDADPGRFFNIVCLYSMSQDELSIAESIKGLCVDTKEKRDWPAIAERQAARIARRILTSDWLADRDRTRDREFGERIAAAIEAAKEAAFYQGADDYDQSVIDEFSRLLEAAIARAECVAPSLRDGGATGPSESGVDSDASERARQHTEPDSSTGAERIAAERRRQIEREGWTPEHDAHHRNDALATAAACYAIPEHDRAYVARLADGSGDRGDRYKRVPAGWPWHPDYWKPADRIRELEKAGALIAAEIDRLIALDAARQHTGTGGE